MTSPTGSPQGSQSYGQPNPYTGQESNLYGQQPPSSGQPGGGAPGAYMPAGAPGYPAQAGLQPGVYPGFASPQRRPGALIASAVLAWVGSAFLMLMGLVFFMAPGLDAAMRTGMQGANASTMYALAGSMIAVALVVTLAAIFALLRHRWAWWVLVILGAVVTILAIVGIFTGLPANVISAIWIGVAVGLLLSPNTRQWIATKG